MAESRIEHRLALITLWALAQEYKKLYTLKSLTDKEIMLVSNRLSELIYAINKLEAFTGVMMRDIEGVISALCDVASCTCLE